jgi:hypothetical protein
MKEREKFGLLNKKINEKRKEKKKEVKFKNHRSIRCLLSFLISLS